MGRSTDKQYESISGNWSLYFSRLANNRHRRNDGLTKEVLQEVLERQCGCCALSGIPLTCKLKKGEHFATNASVDRIEAGAKYSPENVRLVCSGINKWRGPQETSEFISFCMAVAEQHSF